jgi:UDPglucose 6-dehydrogenase/GDP-mannose 6-dehydrogenase
MRTTIIGAGYVGLVTGACLAARGGQVTCVDSDLEKIEQIRRGHSPIHEAGLEPLLEQTIGRSLIPTTDLADAVKNADLVMIAVGTPSADSGIDLGAVKAAARQVGEALAQGDRYQTVIVKSTVIPGTTDGVVLPILEQASGRRAGADFGVGANPEFLTEGQAVADFMAPDRIVLGGIDARTLDAMGELYESFADVEKLRVNTRTAELIKYASNAMLATQISFANELAALAAAIGDVDIVDVMKGVHLSNYLRPASSGAGRITAPLASFLEAGCGFGGSCLPKDVHALVRFGERLGVDVSVLKAVLHRNQRQAAEVIALLEKHLTPLDKRRVAVLGLAFKPDTDDVRESPAFPVIRALLARGAQVCAYDPVAAPSARAVLRDAAVRYATSLREALEDAEGVVIVTRWPEFLEVPETLAQLKRDPIVVDGRRMLPRRSVARYEGIGLGHAGATVPVAGGAGVANR